MTRSGPPKPRARTPFLGHTQLSTEHAGVARIELFLDLVFVYAFLGATNLMEARFGPAGLLEGLIVILLLIRCWAGYVLLGNVVRLDQGIMPPVVFAAAAVILLLGIAAPVTFTDRPGALFGPLVFVVAFVLARLGAILILIYAGWGTRGTHGSALRALLPLIGSSSLLLCGALLPHYLPPDVNREPVRLALFLVAALMDFGTRKAVGVGHWRIVSVPHWAERHRLIVLIALGETIISIGTSRGLTGGPPITGAVVVGSALSMIVVAVLWWRYFDIAGVAAEHALAERPAVARSRFGRDDYSVPHLVMIVGLVLLALGLKRALSSVEPATAHRWDRLSVLVLYGGVILFLLGLMALERRTIRLLGRGPLSGITAVAALVPVALRLPAAGAVGLLAGALAASVLADLTVFRRRHRVLHQMVARVSTPATASEITPEELFFDLMFVYTFIQVAVLMARNPSVVGVAQGLAVLTLLWRAWSLYSQLAVVSGDRIAARRFVVLVIAALTLLTGIATPQAFGLVPGGLPGPLIVVACYLILRLLHLFALRLLVRRDPALDPRVLRASAPTVVALVLLLCAALATMRHGRSGALDPLVASLWLAAVVVDLGGGYLVGPRAWQVDSARRCTDRYALIILIALGQAIISTGVALVDRPISWRVIVAIALSMTLLATFWWAYFDTDAVMGRRTMEVCTGTRREALARDAYAYLHLPMIAGLVLLAFGLRQVLAWVGSGSGARYPLLGDAALVSAVIVYLVANQAFWWRVRHGIRWFRVAGIVLVAALTPLTRQLSPLWTLAVLAAATTTVMVLDSRHAAELRRQLHGPPPSARLPDARPVSPLA